MVTKLCLALLTFAAVAQATSFTCAPPPGAPLCQFPKKIDVAFIGTAVATNENPDDHQNPVFGNTWYQFKIEEPLSGLRPNETNIRVYLALGGGEPIIGRRFFVHAEHTATGLRLAMCGNTRPAEEAEADIAYLRARLRGNVHPYIAGSILRHYKASPSCRACVHSSQRRVQIFQPVSLLLHSSLRVQKPEVQTAAPCPHAHCGRHRPQQVLQPRQQLLPALPRLRRGRQARPHGPQRLRRRRDGRLE